MNEPFNVKLWSDALAKEMKREPHFLQMLGRQLRAERRPPTRWERLCDRVSWWRYETKRRVSLAWRALVHGEDWT